MKKDDESITDSVVNDVFGNAISVLNQCPNPNKNDEFEKTGIVILTDSDTAGFKIRNYIKQGIPEIEVKHAYVPEIAGKEKRKKTPGKEGLLGVEGMEEKVIIDALINAYNNNEVNYLIIPNIKYMDEILKNKLFSSNSLFAIFSNVKTDAISINSSKLRLDENQL